jgi:hypothetical protein
MLPKVIISFAIIASCTVASMADVVTYDNETNFQNAIGTFNFESFESHPDIAVSSNPIGTDYFEVVPVFGPIGILSVPTGGNHATDGVKFLGAGVDNSSAILRIDLHNKTNAFGFWITDFGDQGPGSLFISTDVGEASSGLTIATNPPSFSNGNEIYFAFTQDIPFQSILLFQTTQSDGFSIDAISLRSIPEPSTAALASAVLSVLFYRVRKSQQI